MEIISHLITHFASDFNRHLISCKIPIWSINVHLEPEWRSRKTTINFWFNTIKDCIWDNLIANPSRYIFRKRKSVTRLILSCPCIFVENSIRCEKTNLNKVSSLPILTICVSSCSVKFKIKVVAVRRCSDLLIHVIDCVRHKILWSTRSDIIVAYSTLIESSIGSGGSFEDKQIIIVIGGECHKLDTWNQRNIYRPIDDVCSPNAGYILECWFLRMLECNL